MIVLRRGRNTKRQKKAKLDSGKDHPHGENETLTSLGLIRLLRGLCEMEKFLASRANAVPLRRASKLTMTTTQSRWT